MKRLLTFCLLCVVAGCQPNREDLGLQRDDLQIEMRECLADALKLDAIRAEYTEAGLNFKADAAENEAKEKLAEAERIRERIKEIDAVLRKKS